MARIRTVKPDFFRHEGLQDLERDNPGQHVMLTFAGLWTLCDKAGRFEWKPRTIKLDVLPFLDFDMETTLTLLERFSYVRRYEVDGKLYGAIPSFEEHQRINGKEAQEPAKHPEPVEFIELKEQGSNGEATGKQSRSQEGKGREGKEEGNGEAPVSPAIPQKPPKRATQLPDDFTPNETGVQYAQTRQVALTPELEAFRNWHVAKGTTMKDWQAAWRTWCDKAVEFGRAGQFAPNARASPRMTAAQEREQVSRILTGRGGDAGRNERDITGETERIA
jgi:hypothetical protein